MALSDGDVSLQLAMDLVEGLEHDGSFLAYQPVFELKSGRPTGVEALLRSRHETRGPLPGEFLPPDLGTGVGAAITDFVLNEVIAECSEWRLSGIDIGVSVNIWPPASPTTSSLKRWSTSSVATTCPPIASRSR